MRYIFLLLVIAATGTALSIEYKSDKTPVLKSVKEPERVFLVTVTSIYDGDTLTGDIDLGLDVILKKQKFRLKDINTPEIRGADKDKAIIERDKLSAQVLNKVIVCRILGKEKYGRWLAEIVGVVGK